MDSSERKKAFDDAIVALAESRPENMIVVRKAAYKALLEAHKKILKSQKPAVYLLMMQGWRNGYTVNGMAL
jgi:hypothetical protein